MKRILLAIILAAATMCNVQAGLQESKDAFFKAFSTMLQSKDAQRSAYGLGAIYAGLNDLQLT